MQVFDLKGEVRNDLGKKATKAVRYAEKVPCVLYGGAEPERLHRIKEDAYNFFILLMYIW